MHTYTFHHFRAHRHAYFAAVCTDMDLPDKGPLCFVYFVEAQCFGVVFNKALVASMAYKKLKWGVSACLAPCGAENVQ